MLGSRSRWLHTLPQEYNPRYHNKDSCRVLYKRSYCDYANAAVLQHASCFEPKFDGNPVVITFYNFSSCWKKHSCFNVFPAVGLAFSDFSRCHFHNSSQLLMLPSLYSYKPLLWQTNAGKLEHKGTRAGKWVVQYCDMCMPSKALEDPWQKRASDGCSALQWWSGGGPWKSYPGHIDNL